MAWSGGGYGGYGGGFGGSFGLLGDVHGHEPLARRASVSGRRSSMSKSSLQGGNRRRSVDREDAEISVERRHRHGVRRARYQSSDYDALEEFVFEPSGWGEHENLKQREYRPPSGNGFEVAVRLPFKAKDIFREFCDAHEPLSMNEEVALVEMLRPGCERTQPVRAVPRRRAPTPPSPLRSPVPPLGCRASGGRGRWALRPGHARRRAAAPPLHRHRAAPPR